MTAAYLLLGGALLCLPLVAWLQREQLRREGAHRERRRVVRWLQRHAERCAAQEAQCEATGDSVGQQEAARAGWRYQRLGDEVGQGLHEGVGRDAR